MDPKQYLVECAVGWLKPTVDPKEFIELGHKTAIRPFEYLAFAEKDLRLGGVRGLVNALSNAKRAIDCEVTNLLAALGIDASGNFPSKVLKVQALGLVAPRIVRKVVALRNKLEHDFHRPSVSEVEDAVDVATLFLDVLKPVVLGGNYMSKGWVADEASANPWPFERKGSITSWDRSKEPEFAFANGISIESTPVRHVVSLLFVHANRLLAAHELSPKHALYTDLQAFLIECRSDNPAFHSRRGARKFLTILDRW